MTKPAGSGYVDDLAEFARCAMCAGRGLVPTVSSRLRGARVGR